MEPLDGRVGMRLRLLRCLVGLLLGLAGPASAQPAPCGEPRTVPTHEGSTTRYVYAAPPAAPVGVLVLLPGGSGHVDLDERGCPRALKGNWLVRSLAQFHAAGLATALVDAPSDHQGEDGLAGFRVAEAHAGDLGRVIADLRARVADPQRSVALWLVGTSRGTISAANAAARLAGAAAADGLVLASPVTQGAHARKPWVIQTVFDLPLEAIRMPLLVLGHADDPCVRSPPGQLPRIAERARSHRPQVVTLSGGAGPGRRAGTEACEGRSPHGFLGLEAEVAAGIARFVGGGRF
jgi:hypothetical protein